MLDATVEEPSIEEIKFACTQVGMRNPMVLIMPNGIVIETDHRTRHIELTRPFSMSDVRASLRALCFVVMSQV